ncbi:ricin-type beta-trefoil lectin domain protein [Streptomyces sp. NPDC093984]|uniref:ricin-type beta-trefoil lectin domain protein n=1 Tax=Streptomyces sp. NPDC093984 TaxID=3366052 RepID=UPI0037FB09CE
MTRAERDDDDDVEAGVGMHGTVPDARLTELLRTDTPTAYPALRELRIRHRTAVLGYARLCTVDETAARQLTAQAFALAARDTARGTDPRGPWRHRLLLLAGRVTQSWATDERAARLDPGLLAHLRAIGPEGVAPAMLAAFQALPVRVQGLVWYGVVDQEPPERTAVLLGLSPQDVAYDIEPAFKALRESVLKTRLAGSGNPRCQDFRRLIEESLRPDKPRYSADLHAHMAYCVHCATAYEELSHLRDAPRTALAEGLLPWGGAAYVRSDGEEQSAVAGARLADWWPSRRFALAATAVGVALAPLLVYLMTSGGSQPARAASEIRRPTPPPAVTVTATVSVTPSSSPSPSPSPTPATTSPSPTPTPSRTATTHPASPKPKRPAPHPPNGTYAQVVNVASGLCLDIRDGVMDLGTDVITAPCTSSPTQRWRVDTSRGVLQSEADPAFCLDSRGSTYRGVGIWECSSVDGSNGRNLRFTVDSRGVIRPAIAPDHAVTPYGGDTVFLMWDQGGDEQRWKAGAS